MAGFRTRFLKGGIAVTCFVYLTYVYLLNDASIIRDADEMEDSNNNILHSKDFIWKTSIEQTGLHVHKSHKFLSTSIIHLYNVNPINYGLYESYSGGGGICPPAI